MLTFFDGLVLGKALHKQKRERESSQMRQKDLPVTSAEQWGQRRSCQRLELGRCPVRGGSGATKITEPSRSSEMLLLSSVIVLHNFTLHVKLITTLTSATPSVITIITIGHGGQDLSTTSIEKAARGTSVLYLVIPKPSSSWA